MLDADTSARPSSPAVIVGDRTAEVIQGPACTCCGLGPVATFCAACGQRRVTERDFTVEGFLHESVLELTSFDARLWRTLRALLLRPGLLAREYFDGRGGRYMKPLSLFLVLNVVFFMIQPHTGLLKWSLDNYVGYDGDVARHREDAVNAVRISQAQQAQRARSVNGLPAAPLKLEASDVFAARFDDVLADQKKSMLLFAIPVFALAMLPLYAFSRRRYAEHLVFSVHTYAFFLLFAGVCITPMFLAIFYLLRAAGVNPQTIAARMNGERPLALTLYVVVGGYIYLGLRRMYGDSRPAAALRATVLFIVLEALIFAYHDILFYTTLAFL